MKEILCPLKIISVYKFSPLISPLTNILKTIKVHTKIITIFLSIPTRQESQPLPSNLSVFFPQRSPQLPKIKYSTKIVGNLRRNFARNFGRKPPLWSYPGQSFRNDARTKSPRTRAISNVERNACVRLFLRKIFHWPIWLHVNPDNTCIAGFDKSDRIYESSYTMPEEHTRNLLT